MGSAQPICWQENPHFQLLVLNFVQLGYVSQEFTKNWGVFEVVLLYSGKIHLPKLPIQDRGNGNQLCLHMIEHLEELNLQILTVGKTSVLCIGELYWDEVSG